MKNVYTSWRRPRECIRFRFYQATYEIAAPDRSAGHECFFMITLQTCRVTKVAANDGHTFMVGINSIANGQNPDSGREFGAKLFLGLGLPGDSWDARRRR